MRKLIQFTIIFSHFLFLLPLLCRIAQIITLNKLFRTRTRLSSRFFLLHMQKLRLMSLNHLVVPQLTSWAYLVSPISGSEFSHAHVVHFANGKLSCTMDIGRYSRRHGSACVSPNRCFEQMLDHNTYICRLFEWTETIGLIGRNENRIGLSRFSPVCVLMCLFKWSEHVNRISHISHGYGRSPECMRLCLTSDDPLVNADPHVSHTCGFSPVWQVICDRSPARHLKRLGHWLQVNGFWPLCRITCCRKLLRLLNVLPHSEHR